jgi:hypothetical protein
LQFVFKINKWAGKKGRHVKQSRLSKFDNCIGLNFLSGLFLGDAIVAIILMSERFFKKTFNPKWQ